MVDMFGRSLFVRNGKLISKPFHYCGNPTYILSNTKTHTVAAFWTAMRF